MKFRWTRVVEIFQKLEQKASCLTCKISLSMLFNLKFKLTISKQMLFKLKAEEIRDFQSQFDWNFNRNFEISFYIFKLRTIENAAQGKRKTPVLSYEKTPDSDSNSLPRSWRARFTPEDHSLEIFSCNFNARNQKFLQTSFQFKIPRRNFTSTRYILCFTSENLTIAMNYECRHRIVSSTLNSP